MIIVVGKHEERSVNYCKAPIEEIGELGLDSFNSVEYKLA